MTTRSFSELQYIDSFLGRYEYLQLRGEVGWATFGFDRYMNQQFYASREWRQVRQHVIARDMGCDLGIEGYEIFDRIYIHHMNPMTVEHIKTGNESILDPEFLIATTHKTHNAIHYGDTSLLPRPITPRSKGDTKLW